MATGGDAIKIEAVSVDELAHAALPGADMDAGSAQLLEKELKTLLQRRQEHHLPAPGRDNLTGIALSGGGIRSATFCLGALQALAKHDLLKYFDYLSTVSGGGYIGGSLTWWWSDQWRPQNPAAACAPEQAAIRPQGLGEEQTRFKDRTPPATTAEDPPRFGVGPEDFPYGTDSPTIWRGQLGTKPGPGLLTCLRKHGNYLTPGGGINVLSGVSVVIRAVVLNLLVWLPVLSAVMVGLLWVLGFLFAPSASDPGMVHAMGAAGGDGQPAPWVFFVDAVITGIAFAIMTALYFLLWKLAASHAWLKRAATVLTRRWGLWLLVLAVVLVLLLRRLPPELSHYWTGVRLLLAGALILAATFALLCIVYSLATWFRRLRHTSYQMRRLFEGWAAVYLTLIAVLAVMGSLQNVAEWLTRPSAPVLVAMQEQTSVDATGAAVARPETSSSQAKTQELSGDAIGGLVALLAGLVAAGAAFLRSGKQVSETFRSWGFQVPGGLVATLATALILFGILVITHYVGARVYAGGFVSVRVSVGVLVAAVLSAWLVNSNYVSLGRFYRDRLMEAFMPDYQGGTRQDQRAGAGSRRRDGAAPRVAEGALSYRQHQRRPDQRQGPAPLHPRRRQLHPDPRLVRQQRDRLARDQGVHGRRHDAPDRGRDLGCGRQSQHRRRRGRPDPKPRRFGADGVP